MRLRVLTIVMVIISLSSAMTDYHRPIVRPASGDAWVAGQVIIQLAQSQRGKVRLSSSDGIARFGIPTLDRQSERWGVDDITPLLMNPHPSAIDKKYGADLQFAVQFRVDQDITPVMAAYRAMAEVECVCPNAVLQLDEEPNDPSYAAQYHLHLLQGPLAWGVAKGDTSVINGVIDDGVDLNHPDIAANLWINRLEDVNGNGRFDTLFAPDGDLDGIDQDGNGYTDDVVGWDFIDGEPIPQPSGGDSHGTHCWGIVNAVTNNGVGIAAPPWNSRSAGLRCGFGGSVYLGAAISGIYYGIMQGFWAFSMSFGGSSPYQPMRTACQDAWDSGCTLFGSAGNDNQEVVRYPACYEGVENTAASEQHDRKASFSNYGTWVDVSAPGDAIYSTVPGGYGSMSGTSMACPLACGVACWIKSYNLSLSNQAALDKMHEACDTMPDDLFRQGKLGAGRVSLANVVLPSFYSNLQLTAWRFNDPNANGRPDPGETASLIVTYSNAAGWQNATGVTATLSCSSPDVQLIKPTAGFPDIPAGSNGNCSADSFVISVAGNTPPQDMIFNLVVSSTPAPAYPNGQFSVQCGDPRVLLVDDDAGLDFEKYYTAACDSNGVLYHTYSVQTSGSPSADTLSHYTVVIWFCGNDSVTTLTSTDVANLTSFLNNGRNLMIAGQNIAQDITGDAFLSDYLHASLADDSTGKPYLVGLEGDPIAQGDTMVLAGAGGANNAKSLDGIRPLSGAYGCAFYKDYTDTTVYAVTRYAGTYRVVFFSVPFEAIDHATSRYVQKWTLIKRVLEYFGERVPGVEEPETGRAPLEIRGTAFTVTPNPTHGLVTVRLNSERVPSLSSLRVCDVSGRIVRQATGDIGQSTYSLDLRGVRAGIYLVQLVTSEGVYAQKTAVLK